MTKYLEVIQEEVSDCGICCLESIIKYYNGFIPKETLRRDTKTNSNGTTAYNLIKAAQKYGFTALGKKIKNLDNKEIAIYQKEGKYLKPWKMLFLNKESD
jgi:ATP-binding cassette subfamily B protein